MARTRKQEGGVLDLSVLGAAPQKVKLPDGKLYSMATPAGMGVLSQQKVISRYNRAMELMGKTNATPDDVDEMLSMLLDVCQVVLPDADREVIGQLNLNAMDRLIQSFLEVSRKAKAEQAEDGIGDETGETPTSGS